MKTVNRINQSEIAKKAAISNSHLSEIIANKKRPSWKVAKRLSVLTGIPIETWMEGTSEQIREALNE